MLPQAAYKRQNFPYCCQIQPQRYSQQRLPSEKPAIRHVDWSTTDLPEATKKVITENLTAARKDQFFKTLDQKLHLKYKYLWTKNRQIFIKKSDQSSKMLIANSQDLQKMI